MGKESARERLLVNGIVEITEHEALFILAMRDVVQVEVLGWKERLESVEESRAQAEREGHVIRAIAALPPAPVHPL